MLNLIKDIWKNLMVKIECFPLKIRKRQRILILNTSITHCNGNPKQCTKEIKRNKRHEDWKKSSKISSLVAHIIMYLETLTKSTKKLLWQVSDFYKGVGYKSSIQKLNESQYNNNQRLEDKIKNTLYEGVQNLKYIRKLDNVKTLILL